MPCRAPSFIAVLVLCACPSTVDLGPTRDYPCEPDAGPDSCPAQMRCGLEGRCHLLGFGAAWLCRSDDDCEASWRCGLEGTCHARDVASDYPCRADNDCELDWRCGLDGRCRSRDVAGPFACGDDADCDLGWRCGRSGFCHAPNVPAAYACADDTDCESGWRCSFSGQCLDAGADALGTGGDLGPVALERISPRVPDGYPELVAAKSVELYEGPNLDVFSTIRGGVLTQIYRNRFGEPFSLDDGGTTFTRTVTLELDGGDVRSLMITSGVTDDVTSLVLDASGLLTVTTKLDGGTTTTRDSTLAGADAMRGSTYPVFHGPGVVRTQFTSLAVTRPDGGPYGIYDAVPANAAWFAATPDGLFGVRSMMPPIPYVLPEVPNAECPSDAGSAAFRVVKMDRAPDDIVFQVAPLGGGRASVIVMKDRASPGGCGTDLTPLLRRPRCQPCPDGFHLTDFLVYGTSDRVICASDDDRRQVDFFLEPDACTPQSALPPMPLNGDVTRPGHFETGASSHAGRHGELVALNPSTQAHLLLDHGQAAFFLRGGTFAAQVSEDPPRMPSTYYRYQSDLGLVATYGAVFPNADELPFNGPVAGSLSLQQLCGYPFGPLPPSGIYDLAPGVPRQLYAFACLDGGAPILPGSRPDGGAVFVTATGDQIVSADVPQPNPDGGPQPLFFAERLAPERALRIRSLALVTPTAEPDGHVPELAGYALTNNAVHYFSERADIRWRSSVVDMPEQDGVELWSNGAAARLGYRDGQVYTLSSRVRIGAALPFGQSAVDFETVCGAAWVLAARGVYRLTPPGDGGVIGDWRSVPLDAVLPAPIDGNGLDRGRLLRDGNDVYLVTGYGTVVRMRACP